MIKTYIESTDPKFKTQLNGFCENYSTYESELGVLDSKITAPNYVEMATLPVVGTNVIWNCKVIYRYKNVQIGNWSVVVSIAVSGSL